METKERAAKLAEQINEATRGTFKPLKSTASVLVHALGDLEVVAVIADERTFDRALRGTSGAFAILTEKHVAFVDFQNAQTGAMPENDGPITVTVLPRSAIERLVLECPGVFRESGFGAPSSYDFDELPWGTTLRAMYKGRSQPLEITNVGSGTTIQQLHRTLMEDIAN